MDFRLYSLLCMVASAYCLGPPAELLAKFNNCPQISGPSVVDHLDVDDSGVERLVVHFYKARNSHQIVSFIPSKEYQNCIEDIAEIAGETLYNYNWNSIEGLFNIQEKAIRFRIKPTESIPESPLDIWYQPWKKHHIPFVSHKHNKSDDTPIGDNVVDFPEHDNSSPNEAPVINDVDYGKRPNWHIPIEDPDVHEDPWLIDHGSSHELPNENFPIKIPVVGFQDKENPQDSDISVIETISPDANTRPIIGEYHEYHDQIQPIGEVIEVPKIKPQVNPIIGANHHDMLRPITREEIEAPIIGPVEKPIVGPNNEDKLRPIIREEIDASPIRPLDNPITGPNYHDNLRPIIREEIEMPVIGPVENPIIGPSDDDMLRPIIRDEIDASPLTSLENPIIRPNYHDLLRPIIREESDASPLRPLESPIIGPNYHNILRPIIREEIDASPIRPVENTIIGPNHHIILRPSIREEIRVPVIGPVKNPIVGPNHHILRPIIREEIDASPITPLVNPIIGPKHRDKLRPIIREKIEVPVTGPINNPNVGPNYHILQPIIREEIDTSPRPLVNPIIGPNHHIILRPSIREEIRVPVIGPVKNPIVGPNHHILRPIIREEIDASPITPLVNPIIGPKHRDKLRPTIREEIKVPVIGPVKNPIVGPNDYILRPIIREEIDASPITPLVNPIIEPKHSDKLRPIIEKNQQQPLVRENIKAPVIRPLKNLDIKPNYHDPKLLPIIREDIEAPIFRPQENHIIMPIHDELPSRGENIQANIDEIKHSKEDFGTKKINGGLDIDDENKKSLIIPKGDHDLSIIEHGDSNESLNSQNRDSREIDTLSHKNSLNFPSEEDGWHKVKVPRIDSSGKAYGWFWKSVKSPVRSKSVKWSYWQSSGKKHRLTRWKHKSSSSSKLYHHSSTIANFDGWLKNQIRNMKNKGNNMPSSDHDINTVKVAIEKTLNTNGIKVKSSGVLIDADGNVLRLDNIQLRPIYIGRSLAYNRMILQNSPNSIKYRVPANTPFLEGLLVSLINPAKTLGIVPLGITALPHVNSNDIRKKLLGYGREMHPISIQSGIHKLLNGHIPDIEKISPKHRSKVTVKEEDKSLSEEEPEFRIIGGSFAMGSGTPLANRGRSGKD